MLPLPLIVLLLVVCAGGILVGRVGFKLNSLTSRSCSDLIESMCYVDMTEICQIARGVESSSHETGVLPSQTITRLGGVEGLRRLDHNAAVMMDIARYLILMKPQAGNLAQTIRRDAIKVRRMVRILRWQARLKILEGRVGEAAQILAQTYVSVSVNTLTLYLHLAEELYPLLQEVRNIEARMLRGGIPVAGTAS